MVVLVTKRLDLKYILRIKLRRTDRKLQLDVCSDEGLHFGVVRMDAHGDSCALFCVVCARVRERVCLCVCVRVRVCVCVCV